ncbi:MAG: hypothetical protein KAR13_19060, partial [Desulfobulbaceae bacterium]|nr:hypothetical protein [Desulfobulbaceae bacterium]
YKLFDYRVTVFKFVGPRPGDLSLAVNQINDSKEFNHSETFSLKHYGFCVMQQAVEERRGHSKKVKKLGIILF